MAEYLVVVSHPKQFEYHGTFDDLDAAYAHGAQLGHDDREVGDVQSDGVHLRFGKSRSNLMLLKIVPLPSVQDRQSRPRDGALST
jgi:hypothetical protein